MPQSYFSMSGAKPEGGSGVAGQGGRQVSVEVAEAIQPNNPKGPQRTNPARELSQTGFT